MAKNEVVLATEPCDLVFPVDFAFAVAAAQKAKAGVDDKHKGPCVNDTDGDGYCHKCHRRRGCDAVGGPFK